MGPIIKSRKIPDIYPSLIRRNQDMGGVISLNTGRLGSGKTSMLLDLARRILDEKAKVLKNAEPDSVEQMIGNEILLWRGMTSCQWRKFPSKYPVIVWALEGLNLKFYRNGKPYTQPIRRFGEFKELLEGADPLALNVIYLPMSKDFRNLTRYIVEMPAYVWTSLFMDEVEDVAPSQESGALWREVRVFTDAVKEARKRRVSIYMATQALSDIDYRLKQKIQYNIFMPGAPHIKGSRVWQKTIDSRKIGECIISTLGAYQPNVVFPPYIAQDDMIVEGIDTNIKASSGGTSPSTSGVDATRQ